jgi:hypothetical protein
MYVRLSPSGIARPNAYKKLLLLACDALFIVPFIRDDLFVSREDIIAKISARRVAALAHTRVAFIGLGGVGLVLVHRACF